MKFKVGDWVIVNNVIQQIVDMNPENDYNIACDMLETTDDYVPMESADLWQPKEGEWCWFYNDTETGEDTTLGVFKSKRGSAYNCKPIDREEIITFFCCEPFIGKLPSFPKDK